MEELIIHESYDQPLITKNTKGWILVGSLILAIFGGILLGIEQGVLKGLGMALFGGLGGCITFYLVILLFTYPMKFYAQSTCKDVVFRIQNGTFTMQRGKRIIIHCPVETIKSYVFIQIRVRTSVNTISDGNNYGDRFRISFLEKKRLRTMELNLLRWDNSDRWRLRVWLCTHIPINN